MGSEVKWTPKMRSAVEWFASHEPIGWFDKDSPSPQMRIRLLRLNLIEALPAKNFQVVKYQLTDSARAELSATTGATP